MPRRKNPTPADDVTPPIAAPSSTPTNTSAPAAVPEGTARRRRTASAGKVAGQPVAATKPRARAKAAIAAVPAPVADPLKPRLVKTKSTTKPDAAVPAATVEPAAAPKAPVRAARPRLTRPMPPPAALVPAVPVTPAEPAVPEPASPVAPPRGRAPKFPRRQVTEALPAAVAASAPPRQPAPPSDLRVEPAVEPPVPAPALVTPAAPAAPVAPAAVSAPTPAIHVPGAASPALTADDGRRPLNVLMVASEVLPFAKTGGLADVAAALPSALAQLGHQVVVVMPRYRGVTVSGELLTTFVLDIGPEHLHVQVFRERIGGGASVWLVDIPALYDRDGFYGVGSHDHPDNPRRFAALARAAFEAAILVGFTPDVVHAHDWQGGLAPVYLRTRYATHPVLGGVPSVFTIHNIAYSGLCDAGWLPALDLDWDLYTPQALEYWGQVSLLKAGINFSEKVTTVSRKYAEEILTAEFAYGLEGVLAARRADLVGILNGIDAEVWNPATDRFLPAPYTADALAGKRASKRAVLEAYGLPSDEDALGRPLIGMVSRMVAQKGLDLISSVASELPHLGARFVVLGTGEPAFESMWRRLAAQFPDRIGVRIGFDEGLSHLIEAGSDLFLMPSRFEPCGLNQMYSLRYGTLPLVRATGGLDDTVENYDPYTGRGTGFKFWEASGQAMMETLRWALRVYDHPEVWQRLQRAAMGGDFSWVRSAAAYVDVYEAALARTGRRRAAAR